MLFYRLPLSDDRILSLHLLIRQTMRTKSMQIHQKCLVNLKSKTKLWQPHDSIKLVSKDDQICPMVYLSLKLVPMNHVAMNRVEGNRDEATHVEYRCSIYFYIYNLLFRCLRNICILSWSFIRSHTKTVFFLFCRSLFIHKRIHSHLVAGQQYINLSHIMVDVDDDIDNVSFPSNLKTPKRRNEKI